MDSLTPFEVGKAYFIRTITMYHTGRVAEVKGNFVRLTEEYPVIGEWGGVREYCPKCEREKLLIKNN